MEAEVGLLRAESDIKKGDISADKLRGNENNMHILGQVMLPLYPLEPVL